MSDTVINQIVDKDLCVGCGMCVGICPGRFLEIISNQFGEYNPQKTKLCITNCNLCLKACPFFSGNENEDVLARERFASVSGIKHRPETGFVLNSYYGYRRDADLRLRSASGGITTWLLEELLARKKIDGAICVAPHSDPEKLFQFKICYSKDDVRVSAGSAYYPVEFSEIIQFVLTNEQTFALVGLPCFIKAIRLAQKRTPKLKERIKYLIGLTCGQLKSKHYTEFIAAMAGVKAPLSEVFYRKKKAGRRASNLCFEAKGISGGSGNVLWDQGVGGVWTNRWFTLNACNFCDDVFAETADVVFMDAWLPEHVQESAGANLLISRSSEIDPMLQEGKASGQLYLEKMNLNRIIESQAGVVNIKKKQLAYRLYLAQGKELYIQKRVKPSRWACFLEQEEIRLKEAMRASIRELFCGMKMTGHMDCQKIFKRYSPAFRKIIFLRRSHKVLGLPIRMAQFLGRFAKSSKKEINSYGSKQKHIHFGR